MKIGLDTNILVYSHIASLEQHDRVHRFVRQHLDDPDATIVVTPMVLHEFVHVVTDARRFEPPVSMSEALAICTLYLNRSNVECAAITEPAVKRMTDLMRVHHLGRQRIADTLLVATLLEADVTELASCNADDFSVFEELSVVDPCIP